MNRKIIPTMTTVEMKWGAYTVVWTSFLYFSDVSWLSSSARIIGRGKVKISVRMETLRVFPISLPKSAVVKKRLKCSSPAQGLPLIPSTTR